MNVFEQFKRDKSQLSFTVKNQSSQDVFIALDFDENGAFIDVVNKKLEPAAFDYASYDGTTRALLKNISLIQDRNAFTVDWENPGNRIYLHEHPYLIRMLLESGKFIDINGQKISLNQNKAVASLQIKAGEEVLSAKIVLHHADNQYNSFQFVNDEYAYLTNELAFIEVKPVGSYFSHLHAFNIDIIPAKELQKFLSLFYTFFENIPVKFGNYKVIKHAEPLKAKPAMIFEKVDAENTLFMRISQIMPHADIDFLDDYDLQNFVVLNDLEESINIHPIEQVHLEAAIAQIEDVLKPYLPKGRNKKQELGILRNDAVFTIPEKIASDFIYKEVPKLLNDFAFIGSEKLKDYKININKPRLNLNLGRGIDFLEGNASLEFGDQSISLLEAMNQFKKNRYILLSDGTHAIMNEQYMQKLQRLFRKKKGKETVEISFFDLPVVEELIEERVLETQFAKARSIYEGFNNLSNKRVHQPKINATLRPYQTQGYKWLKYLYENNLGGCLADDMGLGKTLQTITLLTDVYKKGSHPPSILVMPRSLIFNWEKELGRFSPELSFYTWYGNDRDWEEASKHNLILTTYALLRNDIETWKEKEFLYAILDESQAAKNYNSQVHKASLLLNARHRLALSGTPVENNLSELYALFRFLNPAMFGSAESFNHNYLTPIQKHGDTGAAQELRKKVYPFILRRLKKDVLTELPDKIEQTLYVEMSPAQERFYEQRRQFYKTAIEQQVASKGIQQAQFFIFQALNELRQIASIPEAQTEGKIPSPKLELLIENLEEAISNQHKVLVFCNYLTAVELIGEELDKKGIDFVTMTGSTRNRQELVERFQNDSDCKVFLLTLKTGGTGLNLTAADTVFIFDPWWNKAAENQAIDRAHRIGQNRSVTSYKLITLGSIEEKMLQLQEMKSELLEDIISADGGSLKSMSEEDIQFILG